MATRGKNIQLFLMDGEATGRMKCTLANWTGIAYKIPRTELDKCKERDDLKQSGVYFLFGTSDETGKGVVYIGQAGVRKNGEGILNRLQEHKRNPDKDYWTEAIAFTTSNNSFGPTEISYLENRFCNLAIEANRYEVKNNNDPTPGNITEEKESEMEEFIDYAKVIMGTLGHKLYRLTYWLEQFMPQCSHNHFGVIDKFLHLAFLLFRNISKRRVIAIFYIISICLNRQITKAILKITNFRRAKRIVGCLHPVVFIRITLMLL